MPPEKFTRLVHNFYTEKGIPSNVERIGLDADLVNYFSLKQSSVDKFSKVAFVFICLNPLYWQYAPKMVQGAKNFFLPGHKTDFFFWTDIPEDGWKIHQNLMTDFQGALDQKGVHQIDENTYRQIVQITEDVSALRKTEGIHMIPTEPREWPYPTLLRYNLFLGEEYKLKEYDYIFYLDIDMEFCGIVGDEILPREGLMASQHPMYALKKEYWPPYEPNPDSASYIRRPGRIIKEGDKQRFMPLYFAGGFQGGRSEPFINAMKECRDLIDKDLSKNYIPMWNDETVWNKYLFDNPPEVVLSPAYVYPDSLVNDYYIPLWGQDYMPKIKTLTKWFSTSKEGASAVNKMLNK